MASFVISCGLNFSYMGILLICILFNAYIGIVFKYFKIYDIRNLQAIVINYFVCALTASFVMGKPAITTENLHQEWFPYALGLGLLFISTFYVFAFTVQKIGVVISAIFQKMSLIAPTIVAILYFNESANPLKIIGIFLAILAIVTISYSKKKDGENILEGGFAVWIFPLGTFLGSCMIDLGLFYVNAKDIASSTDIDFIASLFFISGCFGLIGVIYEYFKHKVTIRTKDIIAGFALGIPNFFSIYFLLKTLQIGLDGSVVFPINNVGILIITALYGIFIFKEKVNRQKLIGFVMAITSIVLISQGNE